MMWKTRRLGVLFELGLVAAGGLVAFLLVRTLGRGGLFERNSFLHTTMHVDGLAIAGLTMTAALTVFAWRRYRDARDSAAGHALAERRLDESMQSYRSLFDHNPDPVFSISLDGRFLRVNQAAERVVGHSAEELLGAPFAQLVAPDHRETAVAVFERASRGEALTFETTVLHKDGSAVELRLHASPTVVDGRVVGVFGIARNVTERNRMDMELRRIRRAVDAAAEGIGTGDPDLRISFVNAARARMFGYDGPQDLLGRSVAVFYADEEHERLMTHVVPLVRGHGSWRGEVKGKRRDGSTFPIELSLSRLEDGGTVSVTRDITAEKEAAERLRRSEERHREIIAEISEGYYEVDLHGRFTFVNESLCRLFGAPREELLGVSNREYSDPEHAALVYQRFNRVFRTGEPDLGFEWAFRRHDGTRGVASTSATLMRDANGDPIGFRGVMRDETERMATAKALLDSEELYALVTEATRDVIWDTNLMTGQHRWTGAVRETFGYDPQDLEVDDDWWESHLHPEDRARVLGSVERLFAGEAGALWAEEYRIYSHDGTYRTVLGRGRVVRDEHGRAVRFVGAMMDLTERKQQEEQLEVARRDADRANQAKSLFLANMSHEIRTPMNGVIGMVELLLDTDLDARQRDYAETVRRSGEHLLAIINNILDVSKIEAGELSLELVDFDPRLLVAHATAAVEKSALDKGVDLHRSIADEVPRLLRGDPVRISQVVTNLLSNAVKFTDQGEVSLVVESTAGDDGDPLVRFTVRDQGIGITAEQRAHLFQPFHQADASTTRRFGGTGLGLAICRQLVQMMGGRIGLDSVPGRGSTFTVELPLASPADRPGQPSRSARDPQVRPADPAVGGARLLLVEDNAVNQHVATAMLAKLGHHVDVAENGAEALAMLEKGRYAAVLMDLQMPTMDGYDATAAIRLREDHARRSGQPREPIPVIAMTASALVSDRERALAAGMDDHVSKPVTLADLEAVLGRWLTRTDPDRPGTGAGPRPGESVGSGALDHTMIEMLRALGETAGPDLLGRAVAAFLDQAPAQLDALDAAVDQGDGAAVHRLAHKLRGGAGVVGATVLSQILLDLEQLDPAIEPERGAALLSRLRSHFGEVRAVLIAVVDAGSSRGQPS